MGILSRIGKLAGILAGSVGNGLENDPEDVSIVKSNLRHAGFFEDEDDLDKPTGILTKALDLGVKAFQAANGLKVDGKVNPGGETEQSIFGQLSQDIDPNDIWQQRDERPVPIDFGVMINERRPQPQPTPRPPGSTILIPDKKKPHKTTQDIVSDFRARLDKRKARWSPSSPWQKANFTDVALAEDEAQSHRRQGGGHTIFDIAGSVADLAGKAAGSVNDAFGDDDESATAPPPPPRKPDLSKQERSEIVERLKKKSHQPPPRKPPAPKRELTPLEKRLLDQVGQIESSNNYNVIYGGGEKPLTKMTVGEVFDLQEKMIDKGLDSSAVGRYQFINKTLKETVENAGIDKNSIFNEELQDKLALERLKFRQIDKFTSGKIGEDQFLKNLSKEWAALPEDASNESYHKGTGNNKALVNYKKMKGLLKEENF